MLYRTLALVSLVWTPTVALACSYVGPEPLYVDPTLPDEEPPATPEVVDLEIKRGVGPVVGPFGTQTQSSCDDLGFISLSFAPPDDGEGVGYTFTLVEGAYPVDFGFPPDPVLGPDLTFPWIDEATDDQEAIDFTVEIVAIDEAGNTSPPLDLRITDPGSSAEEGCTTASGRASLLLGLAGAWIGRRRVRPSGPPRGQAGARP